MSDKQKGESEVSISHMSKCSINNPKDVAKMMWSMQGPQAVDQSLRHAVSMCWMMLPDDRKSVDAVEREVRCLVDRIIANLREDAKAFGIPETS